MPVKSHSLLVRRVYDHRDRRRLPLLESSTTDASQPAASVATDNGWRSTFNPDRANLGPTGATPFFDLNPGTIHVYRDGDTTLTIMALPATLVVDGVTTRVIEEREVAGGKPKEISRNYFAIDRATGDVYYFGEDVDKYHGDAITHPGVWLSA